MINKLNYLKLTILSLVMIKAKISIRVIKLSLTIQFKLTINLYNH